MLTTTTHCMWGLLLGFLCSIFLACSMLGFGLWVGDVGSLSLGGEGVTCAPYPPLVVLDFWVILLGKFQQ